MFGDRKPAEPSFRELAEFCERIVDKALTGQKELLERNEQLAAAIIALKNPAAGESLLRAQIAAGEAQHAAPTPNPFAPLGPGEDDELGDLEERARMG